jgi:hypothetical protein
VKRGLGWLEGFARFWYEFVVGDDWTVAAGVVVALAATYGLHKSALPAWWLLPLAASAVVVVSVARAAFRSGRNRNL